MRPACDGEGAVELRQMQKHLPLVREGQTSASWRHPTKNFGLGDASVSEPSSPIRSEVNKARLLPSSFAMNMNLPVRTLPTEF